MNENQQKMLTVLAGIPLLMITAVWIIFLVGIIVISVKSNIELLPVPMLGLYLFYKTALKGMTEDDSSFLFRLGVGAAISTCGMAVGLAIMTVCSSLMKA